MHYANGQEAKAGDLVYKAKNPKNTYGETEILGVLVTATAASTTCNGQVQPVAMRGVSDAGVSAWLPVSGGNMWSVTIGELMPVSPAAPDPRIGQTD